VVDADNLAALLPGATEAERERLDAQLRAYLDAASECYWCGRPITERTGLHIDHVIPRCAGGSSEAANLVPACERCNLSKSGKLPWDWLPDRPDLWATYREEYERRPVPPIDWALARARMRGL
jgi:5-methylcytosine-specific restriction endonuclease McrA